MRRIDATISSTIDVLVEAGLLIKDIPTRVERYFTATFIDSGALPDAMRQHLELWLQIMLGESRHAPRQFPREPETVELHLQGLAPVVHAWVEAGRRSFAEITQDDILTALAGLPKSTSHRHFAENGSKSLVKILKGRRLVFANPMRRIDLTHVATNIPLPLDTELIRAELDSPNPATALAVALIAFHALTGKEVRELQLTDIVDGRLRLHGRDIPLAALVPGGHSFPGKDSAIRPRALREDRASSTRSTPPAVTSAASATCSASASKAPPATSPRTSPRT